MWIFRVCINANACEDAGEFFDVMLRVTGTDTHGVQFHDLSGIVLVDVAGGILRIIEITLHRRVAQRRFQQVSKAAERVRTNGLIFVIRHHRADISLALMNVEMIEPKPSHAFAELGRRIEVA